MIITVSGVAGSGKTTVCRILAERLGFEHHYMGGIRRQIAKERGMTIEEFNKLGETDPSTDKIVDDKLVEMGKTKDDFIAEGRTAPFFIPESIKLFIDVDSMVGAERIYKDLVEKGKIAERNETAAASIEEQAKKIKERMDSDNMRYKKYYGIDIMDKSKYDLVIDTSHLTPEQVVEKVLEFINDFKPNL
ncbi:MAG: cytidylate kinase family protein [Candidatus Woesearchaeota archaeon]